MLLIFFIAPIQSRAVNSPVIVNAKWTLGPGEMTRYKIDFRSITSIAFSNDASVILLVAVPGMLPKFILFDAKTGKYLNEKTAKVSAVSAYAASPDASEIFIIADNTATACLLDMTSGKTGRSIPRPAGTVFIFFRGAHAVSYKKGQYVTRGYFLTGGKTTGKDYIVAFDTSGNGEAKISNLINAYELKKETGQNGVIGDIWLSANQDRVFFTLVSSSRMKLYSRNLKPASSPVLIDEGSLITGLNTDYHGNWIFYDLRRKELESFNKLIVSNSVGPKKISPGIGLLTRASISPDAARMLIGCILKKNSLDEMIYFAGSKDKWALHPLRVSGWSKPLAPSVYMLASDRMVSGVLP